MESFFFLNDSHLERSHQHAQPRYPSAASTDGQAWLTVEEEERRLYVNMCVCVCVFIEKKGKKKQCKNREK